jgi:hypothetical protein
MKNWLKFWCLTHKLISISLWQQLQIDSLIFDKHNHQDHFGLHYMPSQFFRFHGFVPNPCEICHKQKYNVIRKIFGEGD